MVLFLVSWLCFGKGVVYLVEFRVLVGSMLLIVFFCMWMCMLLVILMVMKWLLMLVILLVMLLLVSILLLCLIFFSMVLCFFCCFICGWIIRKYMMVIRMIGNRSVVRFMFCGWLLVVWVWVVGIRKVSRFIVGFLVGWCFCFLRGGGVDRGFGLVLKYVMVLGVCFWVVW